MGLDDETTDCIHRLKRAHWIVRMSDGWTEPFLIHTPDYRVDKHVTDDEVLTRFVSVFGSYLQPPAESPNQQKPDVILPKLSDDAWTMLFDINAHPFRGAMKGVSTRYHTLGLSSRKGKSAIDELLNKKLIRELPIPLGGRPQKFHALTEPALTILDMKDADTRLWRHIGHMGYVHQLYTTLIAYVFKRVGYKTSIEKTLSNGRRIDILTIIDEKRVGIEVELGIAVDIQTKLQALDEIDELLILIGKETAIHDSQLVNQPHNMKIANVHDYLRYLKTNYYTHLTGKKTKNSTTPKQQLNLCKKIGKNTNNQIQQKKRKKHEKRQKTRKT
jgi:hypothetical protein